MEKKDMAKMIEEQQTFCKGLRGGWRATWAQRLLQEIHRKKEEALAKWMKDLNLTEANITQDRGYETSPAIAGTSTYMLGAETLKPADCEGSEEHFMLLQYVPVKGHFKRKMEVMHQLNFYVKHKDKTITINWEVVK